MQIATTRFGSVEVPEENLIHFKSGIIGFPKETKFALFPHGSSTLIAWLQSAQTPGLAFPVVSAHGLVLDYPDVPLEPVAEKAGLGGTSDDYAVLAVLCASQSQPATVNLLAPLLINAATRQGAQVFLEGSRFTTRELFVLPKAAVENAENAENAEKPENTGDAGDADNDAEAALLAAARAALAQTG